jgi:hypothetical protein
VVAVGDRGVRHCGPVRTAGGRRRVAGTKFTAQRHAAVPAGQPVGRARLLVAKLISVITYVLGAVILVAVTGYATGTGLFGTKPLLVTTHGLAAWASRNRCPAPR